MSVQTYDWHDFIEHGRKTAASSYHGMPWAFWFNGLAVTHESNTCYLINHPEEAQPLRFTPNDLIAIGDGKTVIVKDAMKRNQCIPKVEATPLDIAQMEAAEKHIEPYAGDPRDCIETDVMNAFHAGVAWERNRPKETLTWEEIQSVLERALNSHSIDSRLNIADFKLAEALVITMKLKKKESSTK